MGEGGGGSLAVLTDGTLDGPLFEPWNIMENNGTKENRIWVEHSQP